MTQGQAIASLSVGAAAAASAPLKPGKGNVKPGRSGTNATTSSLGDQLVVVRQP